MALIELRNISKIFKTSKTTRFEALKNINLSIEEGEFVALVGPSGSGKSTLMNLVGLLDRPSAGTYRLRGKDVSGLSERERAHVRGASVGFVFQTFNLLPRANVLNNVMLPATYNRIRRRKARAAALLKQVGLQHRVSALPNVLSGGERQRVAIARALMMEPEIILADEPTGNLDSKSGIEIMRILERIHHAGTTVLLVTHNPNLLKYAHRVLELQDGHLTQRKRPPSARSRRPSFAKATEG